MKLRSNSVYFYYDVAMNNIYIHVSGLLHNVITNISKGYVHHVTGIIPPEKLLALHGRFDDLYEIELSRFQRSRRKKAGKCNVRFFAHPKYTTNEFQWWLLATPGEGLFHEREKSKNATVKRNRLSAFEQYEAVMLPAPGNVPRWTWRLNKKSYENWQARIQASIRNHRNPNDVKSIMRELHSLPGFRGVRSQVAELRKFTGYEWRRITAQDSCPHIPKSVQPYLRYKTYKQIPADLVIERMKNGKSPFATQWKYGDKNE